MVNILPQGLVLYIFLFILNGFLYFFTHVSMAALDIIT